MSYEKRAVEPPQTLLLGTDTEHKEELDSAYQLTAQLPMDLCKVDTLPSAGSSRGRDRPCTTSCMPFCYVGGRKIPIKHHENTLAQK